MSRIDRTSTAAGVTLDFSALEDPISGAELREFKREVRARKVRHPARQVIRRGVTLLVVGTAVFFGAAMLIYLVELAVRRATTTGSPTIAIVLATATLVIAGLTGRYLARVFRRDVGLPRWKQRLRYSRFAEANGLRYTFRQDNPHESGIIFRHGESVSINDRFASAYPPLFEIGNVQWAGHPLHEGAFRERGYVKVRLDRVLPHLFLQSQSNARKSLRFSIPANFATSQRLPLEGDFDRFFSLYAPAGYGRDALYVLTPDLMALLIDRVPGCNVEIVDKWMYVYVPKPLELDTPAAWMQALEIVETVGQKATRQTSRYEDARWIATQGGGVSGRRLKRAVPYLGIALGVAYTLSAVLRALGYWSHH
ncbi:MAG: hypothetical protein EPN91_10070 [Salinibacterium sp.]|nr:MAG: hypothetical protein EPN91_10070 [Salinibacterium sp.]